MVLHAGEVVCSFLVKRILETFVVSTVCRNLRELARRSIVESSLTGSRSFYSKFQGSRIGGAGSVQVRIFDSKCQSSRIGGASSFKVRVLEEQEVPRFEDGRSREY